MYKFKENKYSKWYYNIIDNAKNSNRIKTKDSYYDLHHIIPKSLCLELKNLNHNPENGVLLTYKEHFICHLLLIKMVADSDVYKMVHAIIRFTNKVKNSNEYNILRKYVSKYSKGKYNKSFGKIWVHDPNTLDIHYILKEELVNTLYIKGLPFQRGGFNNYMCINNGIIDRKIPKGDDIPSGWVIGRLFQLPNEHFKQMSKKRHTKEKDLEHSKKISGRKKMLKDGNSKMIDKKLVEQYIKDGWEVHRKIVSRYKFIITYNSVSKTYNKITDFCTEYNIVRSSLLAASSRNTLPFKGVEKIEKILCNGYFENKQFIRLGE